MIDYELEPYVVSSANILLLKAAKEGNISLIKACFKTGATCINDAYRMAIHHNQLKAAEQIMYEAGIGVKNNDKNEVKP